MNLKKAFYSVALMIAALLTLAPAALAQDAPPYLTHQGRLFDPNNQPISGVESILFTLYDGPDPATATALWSETLTVGLNNGFYTVTLGQMAALSPDLFDGAPRYLGLTVGGEQLNPLLPIYSVAYALHAGSAASADTAVNVTGDITPQSVTIGNTVIDGAGIAIDGQTVIDSTGAWQGAAPGVVVGAGLTGDGSAASPLSLDTNALAAVATSGDYNDLANTPTALSDLACADGEVPKYDATSAAWACGQDVDTDTDTNTTYSAGNGITIGAANDIAADTNVLQSRVFGTCSAGFSIRQINPDGSVVCEDDTDSDTTYTAGAGLNLNTNQFSVDSAFVQTEAVAAMGAKVNTNALHHDRYTNTEAIAAMGAVSNANPLHHNRYADAEAVAAMGAKGNANALHHDRYTNTEAVAAVAAADQYVSNTGDTITGNLTITGRISAPMLGVYCGVTSASYNGAQVGGYTGAKAKCVTACGNANAHMCSTHEYIMSMQLGVFGPPAGGWISGFYTASAPAGDDDCDAWNGTGEYAGVWGWTTGGQDLNFTTCSSSYPIACCM